MSLIYLNAIGLVAPGLNGWENSKSVLAGDNSWNKEDMPRLVPELLPANERRRTTPLIKLAMKAGELAIEMLGKNADSLSSVFASSDGDLYIKDKICDALTQADKFISPTLFHNSVHNAAAGYWAIAVGSRKPSTSISAGDNSFVAGLLESTSIVQQQNNDVIFIAYENPAGYPLCEKRDLVYPFAVALVLGQTEENDCLAKLNVDVIRNEQKERIETQCQDKNLENIRMVNPAAKSLPLLAGIVNKEIKPITFSYTDEIVVQVNIKPC